MGEIRQGSSASADHRRDPGQEGTAYVTVTDGQYLKLNRCTGEKV